MAALHFTYPFLALTAPVGSPIVIVEGWMDGDGLDQVVGSLAGRSYGRVITTGGPRRAGPPGEDTSTYAEAAAEYLKRRGIPQDKIVAVPCPYTERDHTYHSALAVREWAKRTGVRLDSVDVYSLGAHTRRSRLLYEIALGQDTKVGSYAARVSEYEPARWWRTSDGARDVVDQALGYLWVKCCFWPQ